MSRDPLLLGPRRESWSRFQDATLHDLLEADASIPKEGYNTWDGLGRVVARLTELWWLWELRSSGEILVNARDTGWVYASVSRHGLAWSCMGEAIEQDAPTAIAWAALEALRRWEDGPGAE